MIDPAQSPRRLCRSSAAGACWDKGRGQKINQKFEAKLKKKEQEQGNKGAEKDWMRIRRYLIK